MLLIMAHSVWAAILSFTPEQITVGMEQEFAVEFFLDTENTENINAMEGTIFYPHELLELKEIQDGNSIINFWIERPKKSTTGQIRFSGITPGGYFGRNGFIFSMIFQAKALGSGAVKIHEHNVLRNDGLGTAVPMQIHQFFFTVSQTNSSAEFIVKQEEDRDPPEAFTLEIAHDQNLFGNKWFIVFATQDKGSGIDYYEIQERKDNSMQDSSWIRAESPYVLEDQGLTRFIFVRAVDKTDNERIATRVPQSSPPYARYLVWIILGAVVISYFFVKMVWRKRRK